jgi:hypothetical protein
MQTAVGSWPSVGAPLVGLVVAGWLGYQLARATGIGWATFVVFGILAVVAPVWTWAANRHGARLPAVAEWPPFVMYGKALAWIVRFLASINFLIEVVKSLSLEGAKQGWTIVVSSEAVKAVLQPMGLQ